MSSKSGINDLAFNQNEDAMKLAIRKMEKRLELIYEGGGKSKIEKEHRKGKMTARERISYLLDDPSDYLEIGAFAAYEMYEEHGGCPAAGVV
nr:acyl-CoA carboxylase subunit beta [Saprospiraceae bacterium]